MIVKQQHRQRDLGPDCVNLRRDEEYHAYKILNLFIFKLLIISLFVVFIYNFSCPLNVDATIVSTKHDFRATNSNSSIKFNTQDVCIFCHAAHNTRNNTQVLWNRSYVPDRNTFQLYSTVTFDSTIDFGGYGVLTSYSLLCLSCHDGTTAVNAVINNPFDEPLNQLPSVKIDSTSMANLGTDLRNDHPIGFVYNDALVDLDRQTSGSSVDQLVRPGNDGIIDDGVGKIRLFGANKDRLECITCHDPHDDSNGKFLVMSNEGSQLCRSCHLQ